MHYKPLVHYIHVNVSYWYVQCIHVHILTSLFSPLCNVPLGAGVSSGMWSSDCSIVCEYEHESTCTWLIMSNTNNICTTI